MRGWRAWAVVACAAAAGCGSDEGRNWNPKGNAPVPGNPGGDPVQAQILANQKAEQKAPVVVPKYDSKGNPFNKAKLPGQSSASDGSSSAVVE